MPSDHEILLTLARTMDIQMTLREHDIDEESLQSLLLQIADALAEAHPEPEGDHSDEESDASPGALTIHIDGASRGNPGEAGAGVVIKSGGRMLEGEAKYLGRMTNNQAEYNALIIGLERAREMGGSEVRVLTDSELVAHQMNGVYKVKNPRIKKLYDIARELAASFQGFSISHVRRDDNKEADRLANRAIDEFKGSSKNHETERRKKR